MRIPPGAPEPPHRGPTVTRTVFQHGIDADLPEKGQHDRRAAVLEGAGRIEPFQLEERTKVAPSLLDERRAALTQRDRLRDIDRQCCPVPPERSGAAVNVVA